MNNNIVICIGSLNVDITLYVDEFCKDDEERSINDMMISSGGSASNIASGIGRLGKKVYFFGNIGEDNHTNLLLEDFDNDGVDYSIAKLSQKPNNTCYSIVDNNSKRIMYAYNNVNFTASDFPQDFYTSTLKYIIFTSLSKSEIIAQYELIAQKCRENGTKVIFSPGNIFVKFGVEKIRNLIGLSDYLVLSESEFKLLNLEVNFLLDICPVVIITKGNKGVEYYDKNNFKKYQAYTIENPIDSTGAGDCFLAAFVSSLLENSSIDEAINFSIKVAALSVTRKGARSMPTLKEIREFF